MTRRATGQTGPVTEPVETTEGLGVVHLFCRRSATTDGAAVVAAVRAAEGDEVQVVCVAVLGHKADIGFMALGSDLRRLRRLQQELVDAGLQLCYSYVSLTEISEYAAGVPEEMRQMRLYPELPPADKPAWCFYPMSKRRLPDQNWYELSFDDRKELMYEHGASGRKFKGRILQVITGSTGLDDFEWGVTLFGRNPGDLKDVVYTMRYDRASARYAEFGPFYTGLVTDIDDLAARYC